MENALGWQLTKIKQKPLRMLHNKNKILLFQSNIILLWQLVPSYLTILIFRYVLRLLETSTLRKSLDINILDKLLIIFYIFLDIVLIPAIPIYYLTSSL